MAGNLRGPFLPPVLDLEFANIRTDSQSIAQEERDQGRALARFLRRCRVSDFRG